MSGYIVAPNPVFNAAPTVYTAFDDGSPTISSGQFTLKTSSITFPAGSYLFSTEVTLNFTASASATAADVYGFGFYATTGTPTSAPNCTMATAVPGTGYVFSQTLTGLLTLPVASTVYLFMINTGTTTGKTVAWNGTTYQRIA